jgi:amino acid transporter
MLTRSFSSLKEFVMNRDHGAALFGTVFFLILALVAFLFGFYPYPQADAENGIRALGKIAAVALVVGAVLSGISGSLEHKE